MAEPIDVVVVGAGLAGIVSARRLTAQGWKVALIEKEATGGKCRSVRDAINTFDIGGHYLHSFKSLPKDLRPSRLADWKQFTKQAFAVDRLGWIYEGPIQRHFSALGGRPQFSSLARFYTSRFGSRATELFFRPYNEKVLGISLECQVPVAVTSVRAPSPKAKHYNARFWYPADGGIQSWLDELGAGLPPDTLRLGAATKVDDPRDVRLADGAVLSARALIVTAPLRHFHPELFRLPAPTITVINGYGRPIFPFPAQWSWGYLANPTAFFRVGNYTACGGRSKDGKIPFYLEAGPALESAGVDEMSFFFEALEIVSRHTIEFAYPVYGPGEERRKERFLRSQKKQGIWWAGRYGTDRWYSMAETVADTVTALREIDHFLREK